MSEMRSSWSFVGLTPEARKAAEEAAEAAGMDLDTWLSQLIKYRSAIELRGGERPEAGDSRGRAENPAAGERPRGGAAAPNAGPALDRSNKEAPGQTAGRLAARDTAGDAGRDTGRSGGQSGGQSPDRRPDERAPSGAYVRPDTAARSDKGARSLEARAAELRKRETPEVTAPSPVEPPAPRVPDDGPGTRAHINPASNPPPIKMADHTPAHTPPPTGSPTITTSTDRRPAETVPMARDIPQDRPTSAHPTVSAPSVHVAVSDGVPRLIATDMLRPSLLGAINVVAEADIDAAYERWLRSGRLEPLTVRMAADSPGSFEIVAGIDRWHAARRAKAPEVPIIERALNDEEAIREGLAARLKRGHVSALEEADIYLRLMTDAAQTTEQVARLAGKPPAHIATMVRVLNLPKKVREMIERGDLTVLHARALLDTQDPETIAQEIVERRLDIYQTEQLVRMAARDPHHDRSAVPAPDVGPAPTPETGEDMASDSSNVMQTPTEILERHLTHLLGLKVTIAENGDDGVVSLHYGSRDQLSDLIARLNSSSET